MAASSTWRCASTPSFCSPGSWPRSDATSEITSCSVIVSVSPFWLVTTHRSGDDDERVRGVHPVQRLVRATVGVDGHAPVGLHHDQPRRLGEVGGQAAGVVDRAAGDHEAHARDANRAASARLDVVAHALLDQLAALLELAVGERRRPTASSPKPALTPSRSSCIVRGSMPSSRPSCSP